jgi:hypothetical protein
MDAICRNVCDEMHRCLGGLQCIEDACYAEPLRTGVPGASSGQAGDSVGSPRDASAAGDTDGATSSSGGAASSSSSAKRPVGAGSDGLDASIGDARDATPGHGVSSNAGGSTSAGAEGGAAESGVTRAPSCGDGFAPIRGGGSSYERPSSVAVAPDGSILVTGPFSNTTNFGTFALTAAGGTDMFLVKYSVTGQVLWARRGGGDTSDFGGAVAVTEHAIYVAGSITGTATFEDRKLAAGGEAMFLAKYTQDGALIWVQQIPGVSIGAGDHAIAALPNEDVYVTGSFAKNAQLGNVSLTSNATQTSFVVKFDPVGTVIWASAPSGDVVTAGQAISVLADGTAYVTGDLTGPATFGNVKISPSWGITGYATTDFVAAYSSSGGITWATALDGFDSTGQTSGGGMRSTAISATTAGAVYVSGEFSGPVHLGSQTLSGSEEFLLVKYDLNGGPQWMRKATGHSNGLSLAALADGSVYVTGGFSSSMSVIGATITNASNLAFATFTAKYSADGSAIWLKGAIGMGDSSVLLGPDGWGRSVAAPENCLVAFAGSFTQAMLFDSVTLTSAGDEDVFVTAFKP